LNAFDSWLAFPANFLNVRTIKFNEANTGQIEFGLLKEYDDSWLQDLINPVSVIICTNLSKMLSPE
jgi:hypothetical protein